MRGRNATLTVRDLLFSRARATATTSAHLSFRSHATTHSVDTATNKTNAAIVRNNSKNNNTGRKQRSLTIVNVATPSKKASEPPKGPKRSAVEIIKENSDFLRHPLIEQLATPETFISEDAAQLYKFHGGYQQDDREKRSFGQGKFYQFMMRTKQPAGLVHVNGHIIAWRVFSSFYFSQLYA